MAQVSLSPIEQKIVEYIAKHRTDNNKKAGTHSNFNNDDPYKIDINGFGAEMAFCKLTNTYPDFTTEVRKGGVDCVYKGHRVDVKWTGLKNPKLLIKKEHKVKGMVDVYVLMIGKYPNFEVLGFATDDEVFNALITNYGYGDNYTIDPQDLRPLDFLL